MLEQVKNQIRNELQLGRSISSKQKRIKILENHFEIIKKIELADLEKKDLLINSRIDILQYHYKIAENIGIKEQSAFLDLELSAHEINSDKKTDSQINEYINIAIDFTVDNFPHYLRGTNSIQKELDILKQFSKKKLDIFRQLLQDNKPHLNLIKNCF